MEINYEKITNLSSNFPSHTLSLYRDDLFFIVSLPYQANAKRPRLKKSPPISSALKELKWGQSHFVVMKYIEKQIKNRYKSRIKAAYDGLKADQLRKDMYAEISSLKDHYVDFNGQKTGYAVTFVKGCQVSSSHLIHRAHRRSQTQRRTKRRGTLR